MVIAADHSARPGHSPTAFPEHAHTPPQNANARLCRHRISGFVFSKGVRMVSSQLAQVPRQSHSKTSTIRSTKMKIARTLIVTFLLLTCGTNAFADSTSQVIRRDAPKGITIRFYACIDKASSDDTAIATCLTTEKTTQDARLNTTYKALLGKLHGKAKDQLISAERAWLKFQNEDGTFQTLLYGDEIIDNLDLVQNEIFSLCKRANELDKYLAIAKGL
ncbi:MAG: lysozyme inhibitor LprI family protein [Casimicrobiaceae bacterium]